MADELLQKASGLPGVEGVMLIAKDKVLRSTFDDEATKRLAPLGPAFLDALSPELTSSDVLGSEVLSVSVRSDRRETVIVPSSGACVLSFRNVDPVFE